MNAATSQVDMPGTGQEIYDLMCRLYPECRSLTGAGVRNSLGAIRELIPLEIHEVETGTEVFDWTVPKEWNIRDAHIKDSRGAKVVDFADSNLHVLGYSVPVRARLSLEELRGHLYSLPDRPDWIPYRTSYYAENWGFCLSHNQASALREDEPYEVLIDSSLEDGHLTYGECAIKGESDAEVLISTHICHPSMANDNLSGVALATVLAKHLGGRSLRYSYRFLFTPGTIGSITWLSRNEHRVGRIRHGLVLACLGDGGGITYKKSRRGNAEIDRVVGQILKDSGAPHRIGEFSPYGYDERQFCSPGFNLPVGCLMRTPHGEFPEYHTSADDLDFVSPENLAHSFDTVFAVIETLESDRTYLNRNPKCEPQLGRRGLYGAIGGASGSHEAQLALLWVLNLADGAHSLLDIAERSGLKFSSVRLAAERLAAAELLDEAGRRETSAR